MNLQCDHLSASDASKIMVATGGPVHISQGDIKATCGKLTYLIDKKRTRLENNPVIFQKDAKSGKTTKYYAPIITLDQDEKGIDRSGPAGGIAWFKDPSGNILAVHGEMQA
jgi:lipopolysaccharide export system protein LptA